MEATKRCPFCAEEILAAAKKCKHCGSLIESEIVESRKSEVAESRKLLKTIGLIVIVFFIVLWIINSNSGSPAQTTFSAAASAGVQEAPAAAPSVVAPAATIRIPKSEQAFTRIVSTAQDRSRSAENDMQRGGIKAQRDKKVCSILLDRSVSKWVGTLKTIDSNSDGKGVLAIAVADNITVKTWNNSLSDYEDHTLIEPGTELFSVASAMKVGQMVEFSGHFIGESDGPCIKEGSLTLKGNVEDPEFVFRFSAVSAEIPTDQ